MTDINSILSLISTISTHTSLAGRDTLDLGIDISGSEFLLTRPSRDVTSDRIILNPVFYISTHTSLAGRDKYALMAFVKMFNFYSHVPRGT